MIIFSPMSWFSKTLHPSAPAMSPLLISRSYSGHISRKVCKNVNILLQRLHLWWQAAPLASYINITPNCNVRGADSHQTGHKCCAALSVHSLQLKHQTYTLSLAWCCSSSRLPCLRSSLVTWGWHHRCDFFFLLPPAWRCQIQSGQLTRKLAAPSWMEAELSVGIVQHWLVSVASTAAERKSQSVYVIMRQNSFLWVLMSRDGPSIEIPSAGCWLDFRLADVLVFLGTRTSSVCSLKWTCLVSPVRFAKHKMSRDWWQEEQFVTEASSSGVGVELLVEGNSFDAIVAPFLR